MPVTVIRGGGNGWGSSRLTACCNLNCMPAEKKLNNCLRVQNQLIAKSILAPADPFFKKPGPGFIGFESEAVDAGLDMGDSFFYGIRDQEKGKIVF